MKRNTLTAVKALAAAAMMTVASITIGMATGARAEVAARYQANQWTPEAHTLNGAFNNCTMSANYSRGTRIYGRQHVRSALQGAPAQAILRR